MTQEINAQKMMENYNTEYRAGNPTISDAEYDNLLAHFALQFPNNSYFNQQAVEEDAPIGKTCKLPQKMLSTQKLYSHKEIEKFLNDCEDVGTRLGVTDMLFRITPKLDGYAAFRQDKQLFTRGNGIEGSNISHALTNGLQSPRFNWAIDNNGAGEVVCNKEYFAEHLADSYENTRNIIAGAIKSGTLDPKIHEAIRLGKIVFYPFNNLGGWMKKKDEVLRDIETIWDEIIDTCLYNTDGIVLECNSEVVKKEMGSTKHHWSWMAAYKKNELKDSHVVKVLGVVPQCGKIGRITPVVRIVPTQISGVCVSKVTAHNWGNLIAKGIDIGAEIRVIRSGLVIPFIQEVLTPVDEVYVPDACPSCGSSTKLVGDHLLCTNKIDCPAQINGETEDFFKTLSIDGFGEKIIEQLADGGLDNFTDICNLSKDEFGLYIGGKTGENLFNSIGNAKLKHTEDWRFLAAFSLNGLGEGMCSKLLEVYPLTDIFNLTVANVIKISGFGDINSVNLVTSLARIKENFDNLRPQFNLVASIIGGVKSTNLIAGKTVVFTGTMVQGSRSDMTKQAKSLGANVGSGVTSSTHILVCGQKVGAAKTNAAKANGTLILTETEYLDLIK
jgi:DNA ligase (NAD+)